jgi:hypothetical protein
MTASPALRRSASRLALAALLAVAAPLAGAHGDGEGVDEFHEHIDDFEVEVAELAAFADELAARPGPLPESETTGLIDAWEAVEIHEAIELKATPLYPPVWQTLIGLKQALENGAGDAALAERSAAFHGSLLQGLGALKLAASQVRAGTAPVAEAHGDEDVATTVAAIRDALDDAVAHYAEGDLAGAEAEIHEAYMQRFEGLEGELIALDADLVSTLEADFNANLPLRMQDGADLERVRARVDVMGERLDRVERLLEAAADDETPEIF